MTPLAFLAAQRGLRDRLLNDSRLSADERSLAAEMLLHLDDQGACWSVCASWLLLRTGADRIEGKFAGPEGFLQVPAAARAGASSSFCEPGSGNDTIVLALRHRGVDVAMIRIHHAARGQATGHATEQLERVACEVMAPVLAAARELTDSSAPARASSAQADLSLQLTAAELRVAELAIAGLSYKEIADRLHRSYSTVDHQLRSLRDKLGVNSTAKLVSELSLYLRGSRVDIASA